MKNLRIAIGWPHYQGRSEFHHNRMWLQFGHTLACSSERFTLVAQALVDVCGVDEARNLCVMRAHDADADWLLMVDADTWVAEGGDLLQMISDGDKIGATIVGAAVPRRTADGKPGTFMVYRAGSKPGEIVSMTPASIKSTSLDVGGFTYFCPVDAMATACIAINMRHVEFMDQPFFRFTEDESEDIDFCRRVREMRGGWMLLDDAGKPHPNGAQTPWKGLILIDKRVRAFHLNRPTVLEGL